VKSLPSIPNIK